METNRQAAPDAAAIPGLHDARWQNLAGCDGADITLRLIDFDVERFDAQAFATAGIALPPRIARSVHKRQAEFFFGRLAARQALQALGSAAAALEIGIGSGREPLWPRGFVGSIAHDRRYAAAALDRDTQRRGIGIDIERVVDPELGAALRQTVVSSDELRRLQAADSGWPAAALMTLAFSAKESFFKGVFGVVREVFDFDAAEVIAFDPTAARLQLRLRRDLPGGLAAQQEFALGYAFVDASTLVTHFAW